MMENNQYKLIEDNIVVRFDPRIYAFSTNTIPNYLKIGDTFRGVEQRLSEWESILNERLKPQSVHITKEYDHSAKIADMYFRDYSVHKYLSSIGKKSLADIDEELLKLYSEEFFKDTKVEDVEAAIRDICEEARNDSSTKNYKFYRTIDRNIADFHYKNDKKWELRPNQKEVVDNYKQKADQRELLMYAVMRFGKSFTAMQCALQTNCQKVLIVSAKADVKSEWKKTVEMPECFKEYSFVCDDDFKVGRTLDSFLPCEDGKTKIALFLTLQNLSGKAGDGTSIKERLEQVFNTEFDLVIVDETHFGAWSNTYGSPLADEDKNVIKNERETLNNLKEQTAKLKFKKKLHLSGTPYKLLYDEKFDDSNIIATCQFKDILQAKRRWERDHQVDIENGTINPETGCAYQEYDNPYFGFPQMLRFAFNLPKSARILLDSIKKSGEKWTLNDLFETKHETKNPSVTFTHENEVLRLLKMIDGSETGDEVLGFLNVPKIKDHQVCKHIVIVLPYKYCCDAMEQLLNREKKKSFINLGEYEVLNITGHTLKPHLKDVERVKVEIERLEKAGKKTITLTVQKMLTGVTVKEWDTMIMLKNTKSAQEYDQAIFRIQNQYVVEKEVADEDGQDEALATAKEPSKIVLDMKPQTILVDFDPMRMFEIQGLSTKIVNEVEHGTVKLEDSIRDELDFFPIITYNADKLVKVEPENLVEIITQYSREKSIVDEVSKVSLDKSLLDDDVIKAFIQSQSKADLSNKLTVDAHTGPESSFSTAGAGDPPAAESTDPATDTSANGTKTSDKKQDKDLLQKYRMCIANLSFYAFLSNSNIESLRDVLESITDGCEEHQRNKRLFANLHLNTAFIKKHIENSSRMTSLNINDVLKKANMLSKDERLAPEDRALNALNRFSRISDSEVVTPMRLCREMLEAIGVDKLAEIVNGGGRILNIAGKTGEFEFAMYQLLQDKTDLSKLKNAIYTIPTSSVTYEFTRLIYEILGLNVANLADCFTSYDLLKVKKPIASGKHKGELSSQVDYEVISNLLMQNKPFSRITLSDTVAEGDEKVKFDVVVGNPPYQLSDGGGNGASAMPIYQNFVETATALNSRCVTVITPSRWFTGGKGLDEYRERMLHDNRIRALHDYPEASDCFSGVQIKGGVSYYLWDREYEGQCEVFSHKGNEVYGPVKRPLLEDNGDTFIRYNEAVDILHKVASFKEDSMVDLVSTRLPFGIPNTYKGNITRQNSSDLLIYVSGNDRKVRGTSAYAPLGDISKGHEMIAWHKVYIGKAGSGSDAFPHPILPKPFYGAPNTVCNESYLVIGPFDNKTECENVISYISTKFFRFLVLLKKPSQNAARGVYQLVPQQDFSKPWTDEELNIKYGLTNEEIAFIDSMIKPME